MKKEKTNKSGTITQIYMKESIIRHENRSRAYKTYDLYTYF